MGKPIFLKCLVGYLIWLVTAFAYADRPIAIITTLEQRFDLSPYLETIEDAANEYTLEDIQAGKYDHLWQRNTQRYFIGHNLKSKYWFRFTIQWAGQRNASSVLYIDTQPQMLSRIGMVLPTASGAYRLLKAGNLEPFTARDISSERYAFALTLVTGQPESVFGWVSNAEAAVPPSLPIYVISEDGYDKIKETSTIILAAFYAAMASMALYNLCLYMALRQPVYGFYVLFMICAMLITCTIDGSDHRWLWPDTPTFNQHVALNVGIIFSISYLAFVVRALNCHSFWPKFKWVYRMLLAIGWAELSYILFIADFAMAAKLNQITSEILVPFLLFLIIAGVIRKQPTAIYLLFAEILTLSAGSAFMAMTLGLAPINSFTFWGLHWGLIGEAIALSLALAARTRLAQQAAIEHLKNYEALYQDSVEGRFQYSTVNGTSKCNPAMATICGYDSAEEFIAKDRFKNLSDEATSTRLAELLTTNGQVIGFEAQINNQKTKQPVWISLNIRLLPNSQGIPDLVEGSLVDISERKLKETAEKARNISEVQNQAKSQFFASMSHELRTPLTAVLGYAEIAIRPDIGEEKRIDTAKTILRSGKHLLSLINDILDLSKIEAQKLDMEVLTVNPMDIIRGVEDNSSILAARKGLGFEKTFRFPLPEHIQTDPTRLKQILINICGNAVKFTRSGGITVETYFDSASQKLCFAVQDTGIGLKPEQVDNLFGAFNQAEASTTRNFGGTGLGLYLSKQIAEKLGGDITVESEYGAGSTFTLSVSPGDLSQVTWIDELPEQAAPEMILEAPSLKGSVLYAEDNPLNQQLVADIVERTGCSIELAGNGHEALQIARNRDFDLIFTDIRMPVMDGIEFASKILAMKPQTILIAITAENTPAMADELTTIGFKRTLPKPISSGSVYSALMEYLPQTSGTINTMKTDTDKLTVLLADDNLITQQLIAFHIRKNGADVVIVNDGLEAVAEIVKNHIDLVFMDVCMPVLGGKEATELIRKKGIQIPVYALTATERTDDLSIFLDAGCNGVLYKPIDLDKLNEVMTITKVAALESKLIVNQNPSLSLVHHALLAMNRKSLLVADDIDTNRELIKLRLEPYPINISFATTGLEAIAQARNHHFDGILLDVTMPDMDGIEAARIIRQTVVHTPIIFLTGHSQHDYIDTCKSVGGNSFLNKPIDPDLFWQMLGDLLLRGHLRDRYVNDSAANDHFNLNAIYANCEDDKLLVLNYMENFLQEAASLKSKIANNIDRPDLIKIIIHDIKNSAGQVFASDLWQTLERIENHLHDNNINAALSELNDEAFLKEFNTVKDQVRLSKMQVHLN